MVLISDILIVLPQQMIVLIRSAYLQFYFKFENVSLFLCFWSLDSSFSSVMSV